LTSIAPITLAVATGKISWANLEETLAIKSRARIAMVPTLVVIELDRLKRNCGGNHKRVWPQSVREIRCTNCDLRNGRRFFNLLARKLHRG
jgi:hypothetical protein